VKKRWKEITFNLNQRYGEIIEILTFENHARSISFFHFLTPVAYFVHFFTIFQFFSKSQGIGFFTFNPSHTTFDLEVIFFYNDLYLEKL
jgi:hypothetical protein